LWSSCPVAVPDRHRRRRRQAAPRPAPRLKPRTRPVPGPRCEPNCKQLVEPRIRDAPRRHHRTQILRIIGDPHRRQVLACLSIRTNTDRRRCKSIPTICLPTYTSLTGASFVVEVSTPRVPRGRRRERRPCRSVPAGQQGRTLQDGNRACLGHVGALSVHTVSPGLSQVMEPGASVRVSGKYLLRVLAGL
jgi:hypothetical protein